MKVEIFLAWYEMTIWAHYHKGWKILYLQFLPVVIAFKFKRKSVIKNQICPHCGEDELGYDKGKLRCLCCKKFINN